MANRILLKKSNQPGKIPTVGDLEYGEIALNYNDGKLYYKTSGNTIENFADIDGIQQQIDQSYEIPNVLYVAKNGSDSNNGRTLSNAFLTIKAACAAATAGTTIFVKSGDYSGELNPITIPANVSLIGDNLRSTFIRPANVTQDIFYVNNGVYVNGFTFKDHLNPAYCFSFNPDGSAGAIYLSPYIQNCTSNTTTGSGILIDGSKVSGLRSMVTDAFTQINQGGNGIRIINRGYAQLVSFFTICTNHAVLCESGGQCSITNSNSSFGNIGLKATGLSSVLYSGYVQGSVTSGNIITIDGLSQRPNINDAVQFSGDPNFYTVDSVVMVNATTYIVSLEINLLQSLPDNTLAQFYQRSLISASGHTFEYVGAGVNLATALPYAGGVPIQANEVIEESGGKVYYTSTDHKGDYRIGEDLVINRATGTISGRAFDRSLFNVLTPYILALEGTL